ncbi:MAG: DUF4149 domain-containing protein [Bacteriovoracaceae bacterium]|nr:DUF4149 domain-containing protein [Bacteriovoracaceae bacterium]
MTNLDTKLLKLSLVLLGGWFFSTIIIDFIAVPNIFRIISNSREAGQVGAKVFTLFNIMELTLAIILSIIFWKIPAEQKKIRWINRFLLSLLFLLILYYISILNPNIINFAVKMNEIGVGNSGYELLEQEHSFYHHLYVKLDSFKLISLLFLQISALFCYSSASEGEVQ